MRAYRAPRDGAIGNTIPHVVLCHARACGAGMGRNHQQDRAHLGTSAPRSTDHWLGRRARAACVGASGAARAAPSLCLSMWARGAESAGDPEEIRDPREAAVHSEQDTASQKPGLPLRPSPRPIGLTGTPAGDLHFGPKWLQSGSNRRGSRGAPSGPLDFL